MTAILRGWHNIPLDEWPSREDAMAIVAALGMGEASTWGELDAMSGVPNSQRVAHLAYLVYGFPELRDESVMKALWEAASRSTTRFNPIETPAPAASPEGEPAVDTYGFTRRDG